MSSLLDGILLAYSPSAMHLRGQSNNLLLPDYGIGKHLVGTGVDPEDVTTSLGEHCYNLSGTGEYFYAQVNLPLLSTYQAYSIHAWVKYDTAAWTNGNTRGVAGGSSATNAGGFAAGGILANYNSSFGMLFKSEMYAGGGYSQGSTSWLSASLNNTWILVSCLWHQSTARDLYVNGISNTFSQTSSCSGASGYPATHWWYGSEPHAGVLLPWLGQMGAVTVYQREVTIPEMRQMYELGPGGPLTLVPPRRRRAKTAGGAGPQTGRTGDLLLLGVGT